MKILIVIEFLITIAFICSSSSCAGVKEHSDSPLIDSAVDPLNASYIIENRVIALQDGKFEMEAAPGSASKIQTAVWGDMTYGDLDDDDIEDAVLILVQSTGGSGTLYYVAVAVNRNRTYCGTNAIFIGDRITPLNVNIHNGLIVASYADRRPEEPMTALPSVGKSKSFILENKKLVEIDLPADERQVLEGWVTIGHEVRSFAPCSQNRSLWIMGNSPALDTIIKTHHRLIPDPNPYTPIFMILSGKIWSPPIDGFGRDYEAAFFAEQLVRAVPKGNCRSGSMLGGLFLTTGDAQQADDMLIGTTWQWEQTIYSNDTKVVPSDPKQYTLTFRPNGKVKIRADCNLGGGTYVKRGKRISIDITYTTKAMCPPDSLEGEFLRNLAAVTLHFLKDGSLYFDLKVDTGTMKFSKH